MYIDEFAISVVVAATFCVVVSSGVRLSNSVEFWSIRKAEISSSKVSYCEFHFLRIISG